MSKECPKCKTTNYDSATVCSRCGNKFSDGAYYIGENIADIKTQKKKIDKSAKILVSIIAVIVCLIIFLVVFFMANNSAGKGSKNINDNVSQSAALPTEHFSGEINGSNLSGGKTVTGFQEQQTIDWDTYIPVEEIQLNCNEIELEVGQTFQFQATISPKDATNQMINWQSTNSEIIEVADGFVTAKAKGEAQIYVIGENDKYAICNVVVKNAKDLVEPERTYDYGEFIVTAETFLSLRYGPGTDYDEIERIDKDEIVKVYAYEKDQNGKRWAFAEHKGELGWVYDKFLDDIPEVITEE